MIAVGVDTHKHEHVARALDHLGQVLGHLTVAASLDGYRALAAWLGELGGPIRVGIEGAGSYGAGLCEFLLAEGVDVVEVERPRRQDRRRGKSDDIDALLAARKVLTGEGVSTREPAATARRWPRCWRSTARPSPSASASSISCNRCTPPRRLPCANASARATAPRSPPVCVECVHERPTPDPNA